MKPPTLLIDVSYLAYRAHYSGAGQLSFELIPTGVTYGVLKEVKFLLDRFETDRIAFCFDYGRPHRQTELPEYKANRLEGKSENEKQQILAVKQQIHMLRKEYLTQIGFKNIMFQKGYEADDVIAKIIQDRPEREFIIVSSDHDLYQLLGKYVRVYNPHKKEIITEDTFRQQFNCSPETWKLVKAMAGCSTDNVKGIEGVGEKTAIKYICGQITKGKIFHKIIKGTPIWRRNIGLVSLPYPGIQPFTLHKDRVTPEGWQGLVKRLGFASLAAAIPGIPRRIAGKKNSFTRATFKRNK